MALNDGKRFYCVFKYIGSYGAGAMFYEIGKEEEAIKKHLADNKTWKAIGTFELPKAFVDAIDGGIFYAE